jgi:hypothetical protein
MPFSKFQIADHCTACWKTVSECFDTSDWNKHVFWVSRRTVAPFEKPSLYLANIFKVNPVEVELTRFSIQRVFVETGFSGVWIATYFPLLAPYLVNRVIFFSALKESPYSEHQSIRLLYYTDTTPHPHSTFLPFCAVQPINDQVDNITPVTWIAMI